MLALRLNELDRSRAERAGLRVESAIVLMLVLVLVLVLVLLGDALWARVGTEGVGAIESFMRQRVRVV